MHYTDKAKADLAVALINAYGGKALLITSTFGILTATPVTRYEVRDTAPPPAIELEAA